MIIGISGKKQSGKDTIAKIIQGFDIWKKNLALQTEYPLSNVFVRAYVLNRVSIYVSSWEVKKFASKLKEIVSILTGFTVEDLEKEEIKNTNLFPSYRLINKKINTIEVFSSMEDLVERLNHIRSVYLESYSEKELDDLFKQETVYITPRLLLQAIGTDIVRTINPNVWVNSLFAYYKREPIIGVGDVLDGKHDISKGIYNAIREGVYPNWIITDVRFPNELEAIKKRQGIIIRINRNFSTEKIYIQGEECNGISREDFEKARVQHPSETALDDYEDFDYTIDNNNCIDCLIEKVKEILKHEKII